MTTPRIEEIVEELWNKMPSNELDEEEVYFGYKDTLRQALTKAHKAGRDEVVEHFVEPVAKVIYDQMPYTEQGAKPEWVVGGNSLKQDEARGLALRALQNNK